MTQRFGGIFSNLSQREFIFLDRLVLTIPLYQTMYEETNLHTMSDLEIISMLDDYIDTLGNMLQNRWGGKGRWEFGSRPLMNPESIEDPEHMELVGQWREAYPKVVALRNKLARKAGIS